MARYEHLPIYRSAMKLAAHLETVVLRLDNASIPRLPKERVV